MDRHVNHYFSQFSQNTGYGNFYRVIALHETPDINWKSIVQCVPNVPRGWFELCHISVEDRIQFTMEYWLKCFPYHPRLEQALSQFFGSLDDIGVYLSQKRKGDPFNIEMVYSRRNNRGFFRAGEKAVEEEILSIQELYSQYVLPDDYLAFLRIHNGFAKTTDCTGILKTAEMARCLSQVQELTMRSHGVTTTEGKSVNPHTLIPFYESFGQPFYQCFWGEWYPESEMGNVYFSGTENTVSDPWKQGLSSEELMAFPTFTDWLVFYLEQLEV